MKRRWTSRLSYGGKKPSKRMITIKDLENEKELYGDRTGEIQKEIDDIKKHLKEDIKESEKSIKEDKELQKTLGRMM